MPRSGVETGPNRPKSPMFYQWLAHRGAGWVGAQGVGGIPPGHPSRLHTTYASATAPADTKGSLHLFPGGAGSSRA